mmetsp:Transcript_20025/g.24744  ORF Transcript_20025/g.24744 Transcript_20025/m.24744 type:complete len:202 (-) Transcript_20025:481-1086(-)
MGSAAFVVTAGGGAGAEIGLGKLLLLGVGFVSGGTVVGGGTLGLTAGAEGNFDLSDCGGGGGGLGTSLILSFFELIKPPPGRYPPPHTAAFSPFLLKFAILISSCFCFSIISFATAKSGKALSSFVSTLFPIFTGPRPNLPGVIVFLICGGTHFPPPLMTVLAAAFAAFSFSFSSFIFSSSFKRAASFFIPSLAFASARFV